MKAERVFINNSIALEKMRTGEISAVVHVVGKPNELFSKFKPEPGFHFIPVDFTDKFSDFYVPIELTNDDYPNLIPKGEKIDSIGVSTVLAVYNWPKESDRYRRVSRFIEQFYAKFEQFQKPPFQPKWKEINLAASVPGWKRYSVAEELLPRSNPVEAASVNTSTTAAAADAASREKFNALLEQQAQASGKPKLTDQERDNLFQAYRSWVEKKK